MKATVNVRPQRLKIMAEQMTPPRMGTRGTSGVLKGRLRVGSFLRRMITPMQTSTNANSVPMEVRLPATVPEQKADSSPTKTNRIMLLLYGVLNLGCNWENTFGSKPSCDMVKNTRLCPRSITRMTEEKPMRMAIVTRVPNQL